MSPGCKGGRCIGLTTLPHSCADCLKIWEPQPPESLRVCPGLGLLHIYLTNLHTVQILMWVSFENMISFMVPTGVCQSMKAFYIRDGSPCLGTFWQEATN